MKPSMDLEQGWKDIISIYDKDDENRREESDLVNDLRSSADAHSSSERQLKSTTTDAVLRDDKQSSLTYGTSASTGTFVSAKTNQSNASYGNLGTISYGTLISSGTFVSAKTNQSGANYGTLETKSYGTSCVSTSPFSEALRKEMQLSSTSEELSHDFETPVPQSDYMMLLEQSGLLPSVSSELNWSGRKPGTGQHVEFEPYDKIPLENKGVIFCSAVAKIEKVKCRRILLARKSMTCHKKMKLTDTINEVKHLHRLRHSHIVQLVGSYIQGKTFAVLLYPVADLDLKDFLEQIESVLVPRRAMELGDFMAVASLGRFFTCLAAALDYVHSQTTKHMDIKPRNILVKRSRDNVFGHQVYLADFGISRSFSPLDHSQTDSFVARTAKYCAPEVFADDTHGRAADVFSLGCVFLEMQTVLCRRSLDDLNERLQMNDPIMTFHANLPSVSNWIDAIMKDRPVFVAKSEEALVKEVFAKYPFEARGEDSSNGFKFRRHMSLCIFIRVMMHEVPALRPKIADLVQYLDKNNCCAKGREPFRHGPAGPTYQIDSSTDIGQLLRRCTSSDDEKDGKYQLFRHIVESGSCQLTQSCIEYFSEHGIELQSHMKQELLQISIINGDLDLLEILKSSICTTVALQTIMTEVIAHLDAQILEESLNNFPNITQSSPELRDSLMIAAIKCQMMDIIKCLLRHRFDVNCRWLDGTTGLRTAVLSGNAEIVRILLKKGAHTQSCGLHIAIIRGYWLIADLLLEAGADCLEQEILEELPFQSWCYRIHSNEKHSKRWSALGIAVQTGCRDLVERMLSSPTNKDKMAKVINDEVLLSQAVLENEPQIASSLLARGADPRLSIRGNEQPGRTVLHDVASLAATGKIALLHLARLLVMVHDCRDNLAYDNTLEGLDHSDANGVRHGKTPAQMLLFSSDTHWKALHRAWLELLDPSLDFRLDGEDAKSLAKGIARVESHYQYTRSAGFETFKSIFTLARQITKIICLDMGAMSERVAMERTCAALAIIRQLLHSLVLSKFQDMRIFLQDRPGELFARALGLDSMDFRVIYKQSLTQFAEIDEQSIVVALAPQFAARQALADLLSSSKACPAVIICERVDMRLRKYASTGVYDDPVSVKVQRFFSSYTVYSLVNPDQTARAVDMLSNVCLYCRPDFCRPTDILD